MKFLLSLAFVAGCAISTRPVDVLGPGIMCQSLSDYQQRCWDKAQRPWLCSVQGMGWDCQPDLITWDNMNR